MDIYCDESGGVGRGVITLAAVAIAPDVAETVLANFRTAIGYAGEVKGSRINLDERAFLFGLLAESDIHAVVSVAVSATKPDTGEDRGDHDIKVYAALLEDAVGALLLESGGCASVTIDDGRYGPDTLSHIRDDIGVLIGPCGNAKLELSHRSAGLQIADVIANSFFIRALPGDRQGLMDALLRPLLDGGRIKLRIMKELDD